MSHSDTNGNTNFGSKTRLSNGRASHLMSSDLQELSKVEKLEYVSDMHSKAAESLIFCYNSFRTVAALGHHGACFCITSIDDHRELCRVLDKFVDRRSPI